MDNRGEIIDKDCSRELDFVHVIVPLLRVAFIYDNMAWVTTSRQTSALPISLRISWRMCG